MKPLLIMVMVLPGVFCGLDPPGPSPEHERLSSDAFRRGLKQLGLVDLLDYYVRKFPPSDPIDAALLKRELRLNIYSDPKIRVSERLQALDEATAVLRELIHDYPEHDQAFEWQLLLGRDLIDRKAEPYYNSILFRGGTAEDREKLSEITLEALQVYERLVGELTEAIQKIDELSIREFERLAKKGYIAEIEQLLPKARYFSMWAKYYHCLTLPEGKHARAQQLSEIIQYLEEESKLTSIEHSISHYQAQSLLLAGMTYRLLHSWDRAEAYLYKASTTASSLTNYTERHNLKWVVTLAELERIKNFRDMGNYEQALALLERYRERIPPDSPTVFSLHFALALLEGTIYRSQAATLPEGAEARSEQLMLQSNQPLIELGRRHPRYQNEIYTALFELLGDVEDIAGLNAFEKSIYIAGLLRECQELSERIRSARKQDRSGSAEKLAQQKKQSLSRATQVAEDLLSEEGALSREVRPEVRFNLGVCYFEQGNVVGAIDQFNRLVNEHPDFEKSLSAAHFSVRLAEKLYNDRDGQYQDGVRDYYLQALEALTGHFPGSDLARESYYTYARVLQDDGQFVEAAQQYAQVQPDDLHYFDALFHLAQCQLMRLRAMPSDQEPKMRSMLTTATLESARRFREKVNDSDDPALKAYVAESMLISAEAYLASPGQDGRKALQLLAGFNDSFPEKPALLGRVMRLRILAYQQLGELDKAAAIIPDYMSRDPENAGSTLQGLLRTFKEEIEIAEQQGRSREASQKTRDALLVARELHGWALSPEAGLSFEARLAFKLELGEALLRAGLADEALEVFQTAVAEDAARQPDGISHNGRAVHGLAEAYFQIGQHQNALVQFSRLFRETPENSDLWWKAFLRDIQCRMALEHDPQVLYNVIEQKRAFFPHLGGKEYSQEFIRLKRELQVESSS